MSASTCSKHYSQETAATTIDYWNVKCKNSIDIASQLAQLPNIGKKLVTYTTPIDVPVLRSRIA
jgi:hypothetical protein